MEKLYDQYHREHDYLRLSITDRCNLRCVYCMPKEGLPFFPTDEVLSQDEIVQLVENFAEMGISKVRITGGEPLLRTDVVDIVRRIKNVDGVEDVSITTNGLFLTKKAAALKEAGLDRLNISLDTFNPERYKEITRGGNIQQVLDGISAAAKLNFKKIKLNTVLIKGQNDDEILEFLNYTKDNNVNVRFIEFMPIGNSLKTWKREFVGLQNVFDICEANDLKYTPIELKGNGPSDNYQIEGYEGSFGLIHPITAKFCENCNRLRITADGYIKACLYWNEEINIREAIPDKVKFRSLIQRALDNKPLNHEMAMSETDRIVDEAPTWRHMSQIGG
ncbi:GTP 3',8-cyclase MoaA [Companilactobacillus sp.]|uniref:GTP 3',8-cyclase MoaA n=1 Tax=Companilactobacillus sp. TaxID=2767905 RepID=UPI0025B92AA5|nr:GTP 3',8-cyclase MoaA [Companilactobacillus sp.]MCH4010089.1 GTP 3',8-cyclase MoaA [Companilactobacillus sp.]MCH4052235.1 GTP 3',8-cyclase MoaA [Companilactobacillus sp.]MCH4078031.1 GTP 3',8-cyclase MoaA [Companilactobacillus sp.]MCH4126607.1 GTP 3',8-cyclase MoaA [Companilactobacillus sp.]MCH4132192.1 GTP 3',8-cyclase MoaA [Companilactobacillus sp.]